LRDVVSGGVGVSFKPGTAGAKNQKKGGQLPWTFNGERGNEKGKKILHDLKKVLG